MLSINYNGYYINYEIIKKLNFSNLIFEKVYINLIIKLICSLIIKVLLNILIKSILYLNIKYSLLNLEVQKYV